MADGFNSAFKGLNHYGSKRNSVGHIISDWFEKFWPSKLLGSSLMRLYLPKI
jgi:hypothetical protein